MSFAKSVLKSVTITNRGLCFRDSSFLVISSIVVSNESARTSLNNTFFLYSTSPETFERLKSPFFSLVTVVLDMP